jgi:NAD(P)-dependent dehydrogenase (short-subunit alcohol dehydrogenase family)
MNQLDLAGRVAVVTGAAGGLGLGVVHRLAESGAEVSGWDRVPPERDECSFSTGAVFDASGGRATY